MLALNKSNIYLGQSATNKADAIRQIGQKLTDSGFTSAAYIDGLLSREQLSSTFLGKGIAIPHGTPDSRSAVLETGIVVCQFPQGVDWGEGETVTVAAGIAARSNEHLEILSGLTRVLDNDSLCKQLATTSDPDEFLAALSGKSCDMPVLSESLVRCRLPVDTVLGIKSMAASLLKAKGYVNEKGEQALAQTSISLLPGHIAVIGVADSTHTGVAAIVPEKAVVTGQDKIAIMIAVAARDTEHLGVLKTISQWTPTDVNKEILESVSPSDVINALSGDDWPAPKQKVFEREMVIQNANGLHARPGKVFITTLKPFDARIEVRNTNKSYDYVNGKSIMKLLSLGVSKGTSIDVKASGNDAAIALDALEKAVAEGLGE